MATAYRKKYCDEVLEHFSAMRKNKKGEIIGAPSFVSFAKTLDVPLSTIERWRREREEFDKACRDASELCRQLLIDGALSGRVNVSAAKFILSGEYGMGKEKKKSGDAVLTDWDRRLLTALAQRLGLDEGTD